MPKILTGGMFVRRLDALLDPLPLNGDLGRLKLAGTRPPIEDYIQKVSWLHKLSGCKHTYLWNSATCHALCPAGADRRSMR